MNQEEIFENVLLYQANQLCGIDVLWLLLVAYPALNSSLQFLSHLLPLPPLHPTHLPPHYADLKLMPT